MKDDMKKLLLLFSLTLMSISAAAQMMPDSTVQFCSYWSVGEKQAYNLNNSEYRVSGSDTTLVESSTEIMIIEVLAQTETSYQLGITYEDVYYSDPEMNLLYGQLTESMGDKPILITTDQFGSIVSIDNLEEMTAMQLSLADPLLEMMEKESGEELDEETREAMRQYMKTLLGSPELMQQAVVGEVGRMFEFHGNRLDLGKEYSGQIQVASILPGVDTPITANTNIWIDTDLTDEYSAVGRIYTSAEKEDVIECVIETVKATITATGIGGTDFDQALKEAEDQLKDLELSMEEYTTCEVHMGTGWPLNLYYDRHIYGNTDGESQEQIKKMSIEIIIPDNSTEE